MRTNRTAHPVAVLVLWLLVGLVPLHIGCEAAQSPAEPRDGERQLRLEAMRDEFWAAIGAEGDEYRTFRDRLLLRGEGIRPLLEAAVKQETDWRAHVMAAILLERLTKPKEVDGVVQFWRGLSLPRSRLYESLSIPLAEEAKETPMVLVETIWKRSGLRNKRMAVLVDEAWVAAALGHLKEQRALFPLISMLTAEYLELDDLMRVQRAAEALGKLGDPRAVLPLCRVSVLYRNESYVAARAHKAILLCADRNTAVLVSNFADRLYDGSAKTGLMNIVRLLRTKGKAGGEP